MEYGNECSVNRGDGKRFQSKLSLPFLENNVNWSCNEGSWELNPVCQPSPKIPTLFFSGGSYFGVPCTGGPLWLRRAGEIKNTKNIQI